MAVHSETYLKRVCSPVPSLDFTGEVVAGSSGCKAPNASGQVQFTVESGKKGHVYRNWCEGYLLMRSQQLLQGHMRPEFPCSHTVEQEEQIHPLNRSLLPWHCPSVDTYG